MRCEILVCVALACALVFANYTCAQEGVVGGTIVQSGLQLEIRRFAQVPDFNGQRARTNALTFSGLPGDSNLYITDEGPSLRIYQVDSQLGGSATLFFDVDAAVFAATGRHVDDGDGNFISSVHYGVRSLAFHPDFESNGKFYTAIMEDRPVDTTGHSYLSDPASPLDADSVLLEWTYNHELQEVDTASYREVFRVGVPHNEHTIRQIAFNPLAEIGDEDYGLLYVAHGDGSQQSATAGGGQNSDARGKVLRIDPLQSGADSYTVPATNPFVGDPSMLDEVYTLGHRNPHNLAFARDSFGDVQIILAEIGRDNVDEINLLTAGGNYGWSEREGTFLHLNGGGNIDGVSSLPANEADFGYLYPAAQYGHDAPAGAGFVGRAIAGGYVVSTGELAGEYIFSEFGNFGRVFHVNLDDMAEAVTQLDPSDPTRDEPGELTQVAIQELSILFDHDDDPSTPSTPTTLESVIANDPDYNNSGRYDIRFGQGPDGALYILNKNNGWIYEAVGTAAPDLPGDFNGDGLVNLADYTVWRNNLGSPDEAVINGSGDGLAGVDQGDYELWKTHFGESLGEASELGSAVVPEPATSSIILVGLAVLFASGRSHRR